MITKTKLSNESHSRAVVTDSSSTAVVATITSGMVLLFFVPSVRSEAVRTGPIVGRYENASLDLSKSLYLSMYPSISSIGCGVGVGTAVPGTLYV